MGKRKVDELENNKSPSPPVRKIQKLSDCSRLIAPPILLRELDTMYSNLVKKFENKNAAANTFKHLKTQIELIRNSKDKDDRYINTLSDLLIYAVSNNHFKASVELLKGGAKVDIQNELGNTPLHLAIEQESAALSMQLIRYGAKTDVPNNHGWTALELAALYAHFQIVNAIVKNGAKCNFTTDDNSTLLHIAANYGQLETLQLVLATSQVDIRATNMNGQTALHVAALSNHPDIVEELLTVDSNINLIQDSRGRIALHEVADNGFNNVVNVLLKTNQAEQLECKTGDNGYTPLLLAVEQGHTEVVGTLLDKGANIDANNAQLETPIAIAFCEGHYEIFTMLLAHGAVLPENLNYFIDDDDGEELNGAQSAHTVSVHVDVSRAAKELKPCYLDNQEALPVALDHLKKFIEQLPYNKESDPWTNKYGASVRCFGWLMGQDYTDIRSVVTLKEALGIYWLALNDKDELQHNEAIQGLENIEEFNPEQQSERMALRLKTLQNNIAETFYQIKRGYNLSEEGVDNGKEDDEICLPGAFNQLFYALNARHRCVNIRFVTKNTILEKANALTKSLFCALPMEQKENYINNESNSGVLKDLIGDHLALQLHQEFDEFAHSGLDVKKTIDDFIENLDYVELDYGQYNRLG